MKINEEICKEHTDVLEAANDQCFYGYNFEVSDYIKLVEAMRYFENIKVTLRKKLIKEGKL